MLSLRSYLIPHCKSNIHLMRSLCTNKWFVENLNKRAILKISGPDTNNYLQSMVSNDIKYIENSPTIYSLLLNARGRVLYDILLYKINCNEYLIEYEKSAFEYLDQHLLMYRLRKNVMFEPLKHFSVWVIYSQFEQNDPSYATDVQLIVDFFKKQEHIITSVIDPRTNLLGVRVVTANDCNLISEMPRNNFKFIEGDLYRTHRYKLGVGEGVLDHPPGNCLPFDTNVDFMNGVSFNKGCYIGQELTARLQFTLNVSKRLMPIVLESKDTNPEFPPECTIVNEKDEKMGRLRSNLGQYGLALLKYEESLKAKCLSIKGLDVKLKVSKPTWWPDNVNNKN